MRHRRIKRILTFNCSSVFVEPEVKLGIDIRLTEVLENGFQLTGCPLFLNLEQNLDFALNVFHVCDQFWIEIWVQGYDNVILCFGVSFMYSLVHIWNDDGLSGNTAEIHVFIVLKQIKFRVKSILMHFNERRRQVLRYAYIIGLLDHRNEFREPISIRLFIKNIQNQGFFEFGLIELIGSILVWIGYMLQSKLDISFCILCLDDAIIGFHDLFCSQSIIIQNGYHLTK